MKRRLTVRHKVVHIMTTKIMNMDQSRPAEMTALQSRFSSNDSNNNEELEGVKKETSNKAERAMASGQ